MGDNNRLHTYPYCKTVSIKFECIYSLIAMHKRSMQGMWKDCISIEGLGMGMWKDFVAMHKGSECARALICIAIDDPLGGGRREQSSALTPTRSKSQRQLVNPTKGITYSEARSHMAAKSSPGGFVVATVTIIPDRLWRL